MAQKTNVWQRVLSDFAHEIGRLHQAGVRILAGSDMPTGRLPGEALQDELEYLVHEAGFTPAQAIESVTRVSAEFAHMSDSLGLIARGKVADLVLLSGDPLADMRNIRRIFAVWQGGKRAGP